MMLPPVGMKIEIDPCPSGTTAKLGRIWPGAATLISTSLIVAFRDGEADRKRYRSFHIRGVSGLWT